MATRSVPALLEDIRFLGETQYAIVQAVRALVLQPPFEAPTEEVKYGGILFAAQGVSFCGVFAYRRMCRWSSGRARASATPSATWRARARGAGM
mgnify:FL=1